MPMVVFVSCVGDLAILGGSIGCDLGPPPPPTFFLPPPLGYESFILSVPLRCDRVEFLRRGDGSRTHDGNGRCLDKYSAGA